MTCRQSIFATTTIKAILEWHYQYMKEFLWNDEQMKAILAKHEEYGSISKVAINHDILYTTFKKWYYRMQ